VKQSWGPSETGSSSRTSTLREATFGPPAAGPLARAAQVSLQLLLVVAGLALVGFLILQLRLVVFPALFALLLAAVLMPVADRLRRVMPDGLAALIVVVVSALLLGGVVALLAPSVIDELGDLGASIRQGLGQVASALGTIGVSQVEIDAAIDGALEQLRQNSAGLGRSILTGATLVAEMAAALVLVAALLFFLLKDGDRIWGFCLHLLPARRRGDAEELGRRSWTTVSHYVRGVALVALFDSVLIGTALAILGVPLVLPLAVLTFIGGFFPLVGAITAGAVAALVALVSNGVITALIVVAVITLVQQLEGNVVFPLIVGRTIRLHPVPILLALTAGAVVGGVLGALFAVPLVALAWTVLEYAREPEEEEGPAPGKPERDVEVAAPT
jgi:predicted PurR-regulated permease PerM